MNKDLTEVLQQIKKGRPFYLKPYRQPKIWGVKGIGEYWYGAEPGEKSSIAVIGGREYSMYDILNRVPEEILGRDTMDVFGKMLPLVKILTPKGRLSVQFHDSKNELWIVTGIDKITGGDKPSIIVGFNGESVDRFGKEVTVRYAEVLKSYGELLNKVIGLMEDNGYGDLMDKEKNVIRAAEIASGENDKISSSLRDLKEEEGKIEFFYNYREVKTGDVIPIPSGTLHALGPGVEIVEPQIPGPTQSLEDGANYPVRYYFPGFERQGAEKKLDIDRTGEMLPETARDETPEEIVPDQGNGYAIERLPGKFEDKGLEVHRIRANGNAVIKFSGIKGFHTLVLISGKAVIRSVSGEYEIPLARAGGNMLFIPASTGDFETIPERDSEIIDTFTPLPGHMPGA